VKRVLLVGAGHAHAWLLASLAKDPVYGARFTVVSPSQRQLYSAMLPGVVAGHYRRTEAEFDVALLAERAYGEFIAGSVTRLDAERRIATLSDGREIAFEIASLNAGSGTEDSVPGSREHALSVKPFERLVERLRVEGDRTLDAGQREAALQAMSRDKKVRHGRVRFVLLDRIGEPALREVRTEDCSRALAAALT